MNGIENGENLDNLIFEDFLSLFDSPFVWSNS